MQIRSKILSSFAMTVFVYLIIEGFSVIAYGFASDGEIFSFEKIHSRRESVSQPLAMASPEIVNKQGATVHPYFGFVHDPKQWKDRSLNITDFGFLDDHWPVVKRSPGQVNIAILGGSVAWWFSSNGWEVFREELRRIPQFREKKLVLIRAAAGGYKQPQQLLILSYLYSLGAEYDIVINLDGFNEVTLAPIDHQAKEMYPHYPLNWDRIVQQVPQRETRILLGRLTLLEEFRTQIADFFDTSWLKRSVAASTIWLLLDKTLATRITHLRSAHTGTRDEESKLDYVATGPSYSYSSKQKLIEELIQVWNSSSFLMEELTRVNGGRYFHFLQPNQYLPNSKTLSSEEAVANVRGVKHYQQLVEYAYPKLQAAGKDLAVRGVAFYNILKSVPELVKF